MNRKLSDLDHSKRGAVILATCIVQTLNESDPSFQERFLERLEQAYYKLRDDEASSLGELEMMAWAKTLLTGWDPVAGQGKPFLKD